MDKWVWNEQENEAFSVKGVRKLQVMDTRSVTDSSRLSGFKWEGWVPLKVALLNWRVARDRIPTRVALVRRGISIPDVSCPLCGYHSEDVNHLIVRCRFAYGIWSAICSWCRLDPFYAYDFEDLFEA